jgi:hypothetical protein
LVEGHPRRIPRDYGTNEVDELIETHTHALEDIEEAGSLTPTINTNRPSNRSPVSTLVITAIESLTYGWLADPGHGHWISD